LSITPLFRCWEVLQEHYDEHTRTSTVSCSTPDCPCRGHVSAEFVENALVESRQKRKEAEHALEKARLWLGSPSLFADPKRPSWPNLAIDQ